MITNIALLKIIIVKLKFIMYCAIKFQNMVINININKKFVKNKKRIHIVKLY